MNTWVVYERNTEQSNNKALQGLWVQNEDCLKFHYLLLFQKKSLETCKQLHRKSEENTCIPLPH